MNIAAVNRKEIMPNKSLNIILIRKIAKKNRSINFKNFI